MEVILAVLRDVATVDGARVRCARIPNPRGGASTVTTDDGERVPCSLELVFRRSSAPAVGATLALGGVSGHVMVSREQDAPGPWMRHTRVWVATRADVLGGPLDTTVTVFPSAVEVDGYGTPRRVPSATGTAMIARLDPASTDESHADGQRRTQTWTLTVDTDLTAAGCDAYAVITDADGMRYALDGDPIVHTDPAGNSWSTARVRRYGDGGAV